MSKESVTKYGALADNFMTDTVVRFNPNVSNKAGNGKKRKSRQQKMRESTSKHRAQLAKEDVWKIAEPRNNTHVKKREAAVLVEELRATRETFKRS